MESTVRVPEPMGVPHRTARPHPGVRRLLARDHWGIPAGSPPHTVFIPASASVPMILKIRDTPHRPPAFLHGVHDRAAVMNGECAPSYLSVMMAPLGAYRLLGRPVPEFGDEVVDLEAVFGAAGRRLLEAVRDAGSWRARFDAVDSFLLEAAERGPRPAPEVHHAWHLIAGSGGAMQIRRVAAEVGWSHKHLISRFTAQVGLPPKTVARLTRFERVLGQIQNSQLRNSRARNGRRAPWGQVAAEAGYADQPHLIREFQEFTGTTPAGFLKTGGPAPPS